MTNNNNLFEGFWDSLVTKAKQGAYAAAGALGSGAAKGKLSASLLSDGMFQQWKEWAAKTGSDLNAQNFSQFLGKMGFSKDFTAVETAELNKFIGPSERAPTADDHLDAAATKAKQDREAAANPEPATKAKPARKPFPQSAAQQAASKTTANNQKMQQQKAMQQRMQDKKAAGPRAKQTRESLEEDVIQDAELRKFFDQLAQRALKSGEAKSAAQKTIEINRVSPAGPEDQEAAPEQEAPAPQAAPTQQAAPAQRKAFPGSKPGAQATPAPAQPPAQQPAQPPATPAPAPAPAPAAPTVLPPGSDIQLSDREKEIMSAFPAGTKLGTQVTATDPEVQELAQKVLQAAFDDYKKRTPVAASKAKPKAAPKPAPAAAPPAPPATPAA